jgi:phage terminase large subunit GpA-like protein
MSWLLRAMAKMVMPPPLRTPDQWADQTRQLPQGSAEPGPFRSNRTPYMIPVVRAAVNPNYKRIVLVCGSQMAKTEALFNIIGHRLEDDPKPILYVGPTQKLVESYSEGRVMPMIKTCPTLWERLAKGKKNKITEKFFGGVRLGFGWAGSATELAGHPAALVLVDERDRMTAIKGEGDPVSLAEARTSTYPDGKVIVASTPTVGNVNLDVHPDTGMEHWRPGDETEIASPIWRLWQKGTRCEWAWPCPHCSEYFIPRFKHLQWPEKSTPEQALENTKMACPKCGSLIEDNDKGVMNARGRFISPGQRVTPAGEVVGAASTSNVASFWISGLCSPWRSFGSRAAEFIAAVRAGNQDEIQVALNTGCGELYALGGDAPSWEQVRDLAEGYESGTVPEGVQMITCAVDVQKDRLVYGVRGWGFNSESWLIEADEIWGETAHDAVWMELDELLTRDFDGKKIRLMLIDSGYRPGEKDRNPDNQIYSFCRRHRGRAFPTKGHDKQDRPVKASKIDISYKGKIIKNGLDLWHVDTDYCKSWVHARIEWPQGEPGGWHLPSDITDDYCMQLTAEARTVGATGKILWVRIRKENHFFDVESLNVAAAHVLRLHALPRLVAKEAATVEDDAPAVETPAPRAAAQAQFAKFPRGNWTTGWRD